MLEEVVFRGLVGFGHFGLRTGAGLKGKEYGKK